MLHAARRAINGLRKATRGYDKPREDVRSQVAQRVSNIKRTASVNKLDGLGVRDIPVFSHPIHEIPRLERYKGYIPINRVVSPTVRRSENPTVHTASSRRQS